jgi:murein tripeptide amidase MpaA
VTNYHITVYGADRAGMADIVRRHDVRVYAQTLKAEGTGFRVDGVGDDAAINRLSEAGYRVERHEDLDEAAQESLADVGTGNRFAAEAAESAMRYLNVAEVETALQLATGAANAGFTELITLPHITWEGRTCRAVRIHHGPAAAAGVYFLGGVHAREWGSPDILVNFVKLLTDAYRTGTGISQGGMSLAAGKVAEIVETLDVVVFPQANPDGRHHSMTVDPMWRKNRHPVRHGDPHCAVGGGKGPGVDLNRNYDFQWDFTSLFSPDAPLATSTDPCSEVYRGPSAASEPETANVSWLLDRVPSVRYFIDVHSFGEDILYTWGDDDNQTTDPTMNFQNPAFDGKRGIPDAAPGGDPKGYREYLPPTDLKELVHLGAVMHDAIEAAHGRQYTVKGAVDLYPTSGTSDDYAYSRNFVNAHKPKVFGYTIEWGPQRTSIPKSFHPDYADMVPIIEEVTAALLAFCSELAGRLATPDPTLESVRGG